MYCMNASHDLFPHIHTDKKTGAQTMILKSILLFIHFVYCRRFGSFTESNTNFGFLKEMIVFGFAAIGGIVPLQDQTDLQNYR